MTAGRMDHRFYRDRAVRTLLRAPGGHAALGTWTLWWSWCLDAPELNGEVPDAELNPADAACAELLVASGLWERIDGGYRIARFAHYVARVRLPLDRQAIFERDDWTCTYCGASLRPGFAHVDHVVPVVRGGSDDLTNLAAACPPCNLQKGAKTLEEWRA